MGSIQYLLQDSPADSQAGAGKNYRLCSMKLRGGFYLNCSILKNASLKLVVYLQVTGQNRPSIEQNAQHKIIKPPAVRSDDFLQFSKNL
jgi:hypothetical protein